MKTTDNMNSEDSLRIITEMIHKTKLNISRSSFHLLFWGWLILLCSLSEYLLASLSSFEYPYMAWLLTIPGVFVSLIRGFRMGRKHSVQTYADRLNMWTWLAFLVVMIIMFLLLSSRMNEVGPFILLIAGYATFMSGIIIRFKPLILGGLSFWAFAIIAYFINPAIAPLAVPLAVISGYLLPGYLLKKEYAK